MPGAGRPEQPLVPSAGPLYRLASELRELRRRKGLTYRELAAETGLAISTLRGAASGETVPTWRVAQAFVTTCGGDSQQVRNLWEDACAAAGKPPEEEAGPAGPPDPATASTPEEFTMLMRRLRAWAGNPSLKTLNERSGGYLLPPATVSEALRRQTLPRRRELLSAYVRACGLTDEEAQAWEQAWTSLKAHEAPELTGTVVSAMLEGPAELATAPDKKLLSLHAEGNPDAFPILVRRHYDRMMAVAMRTLGDADEAADALQEALLAAYRAADRFRGDASVVTWLHRIVVNACLDRLRRRSIRPVVPMGDDATLESIAPNNIDSTLAHEVSVEVSDALRLIPFEQRAALVLVDMMGYTTDDAARVLDVPPGTVKSRCARGRARLAPLLKHLKTTEISDNT
ncbi:hypothetical protein GCM10023191_101890 [Actinoallomurus oryzae]|uniref:HTH cro/C1-type domain-containing protein n=2 Tax=Actinoallomurus oryzae TaxID=502180 RepID=A0ABP8RAA0_9ACTN